jgi:hypothetical protein
VCVRGASALQAVLDERRDDPITVQVVWERVLWSDWAVPSAGLLARLPDPRAAQYWDRGRFLSERIRAAGANEGRAAADIVWDIVFVFPRGVRWDAAFPHAAFADGPVVGVMDEFRRALGAALGS